MSGFDLVARLLGFERRPALKARPSVNGVEAPYTWPAWRAGQPDWTPATLQGYAEAGYEGNSLVLACIRRRAQSAAFVPLLAYTGQRNAPELLPDEHPLNILLRRPNFHQSWYEFAEQGITYLDLDGNLFVYLAYARLNGKARGDFPAGMFLLRSDRVRVVPGRSRSEPLLGYVYDSDDTGAFAREPFLPHEVIHVKYPNPRDPFEGFGRGTSPLVAAARIVDVDNSATSFLKNFFDQGVVPYGLLKSKQTLVDEEVARIRDRIRAQYAGSQNWGEVMILDADAEYQQMGMSFQDMTFDALDMRNEVRICEALDVPPILVGAKAGLTASTYSNYEQARSAFWQDSLIPGVYRRLEDAFNLALATQDVWLAYDYGDVPALRENEVQKAETASRLFLGGVAKRNESRAMVGLEPVPPEEDGFRAAEDQQIGSPAITQTPVTVDGEAAAGAGDEAEGEKGHPFGGKATSTRDSGALKERLRIERTWAPKLTRALRRQLRLALPAGAAEADVWSAVNRLDLGAQAVRDTVYQMMREAVLLGLDAADGQVDGLYRKQAAERKLEMDIDWSLVNSEVLDWLKTYTADLVGKLNEHSREALRQAIGRWVENGLPLRDLIGELEPIFGTVRAEMIAATEVTRAFAEANVRYWQATGAVTSYSIRTAMDERVCAICGPLGGVRFDENGPVDTSIEEQNRNAVVSPLGEGFTHPGGGGRAGKYEGTHFDMPPFHPRCILPGNEVVVPGGVSAAAKSFYVGRCVEIRLANGRELTVTENHPILTVHGWVAAQFISKGDDVICATDAEWIAASIQPDDDNRPAKIEDVFSALMETSQMKTACVPASTEDFYGDGRSIHGNIDIVHVNDLLERNSKPAFFELVSQHGFDVNGMRQGGLARFGMGDLFSARDNAAASRLMGAGEHGVTLFGRSFSPTDEHRIRDVTGANACFQKPPAKCPTIDTGFAGKFLFRFAGDVASEQIIEVRNGDSTGWHGSALLDSAGLIDTVFDKRSAQGFPIDATLAREFCETFAGEVASSKVSEIRDFEFSGHVYDLQADVYELYICNGAIVKNCRCFVVPEI